MKLFKFLFTVLWGLGYLGNAILFISIEWSFLQQSFIQIFNPLLHLQVFGILLTARLFWVFLTMAVVGSYAVSIIDRYIAQATQKAEFHAKKATYQSPPRFQETKPNSSLPSVRSKQTDSYVPPQTEPKPTSKVETVAVEREVKLLEWAIQSSQKVRFSYETRSGEKSERTVTPIRFKTVKQTQNLCLEGYCHLRNAKRNFAIFRMRDIEIVSASQVSYEQVASQKVIIPDVEVKASPTLQSPSSEVIQTNDYQQVTSEELITPADIQVEESPISQSPLPKVTQKNNYQQATSEELITPTDIQMEESPALQFPSPEITQTKNTNTQVKQRPYLKYRTNELETIAASKWNDTEVLNQIHYELEFRSRKKALDLRKRITTRLSALQETQFAYPTTKANPSSQNLSNDVFKYEQGLLKHYGYKVGKSGLSQTARWRILDRVFSQPLLQIDNAAYLSEWGEPKSAKRLQKMVDSIAAFTRNAKRRNRRSFSKAIQDWETDLAYLKRSYYDNYFSFVYPRT
jgi:hypothetical protein